MNFKLNTPKRPSEEESTLKKKLPNLKHHAVPQGEATLRMLETLKKKRESQKAVSLVNLRNQKAREAAYQQYRKETYINHMNYHYHPARSRKYMSGIKLKTEGSGLDLSFNSEEEDKQQKTLIPQIKITPSHRFFRRMPYSSKTQEKSQPTLFPHLKLRAKSPKPLFTIEKALVTTHSKSKAEDSFNSDCSQLGKKLKSERSGSTLKVTKVSCQEVSAAQLKNIQKFQKFPFENHHDFLNKEYQSAFQKADAIPLQKVEFYKAQNHRFLDEKEEIEPVPETNEEGLEINDGQSEHFFESTGAEFLMEAILNKFSSQGVSQETLKANLEGIEFLIKQEFSDLLVSFHFGLIAKIVCESLAHKVVQSSEMIMRAIAIVLETVGKINEGEVDPSKIIQCIFGVLKQLWKLGQLEDFARVLNAFCYCAKRELSSGILVQRDSVKLCLLSETLHFFLDVLGNQEESNFQNAYHLVPSCHFLLKVAFRDGLVRWNAKKNPVLRKNLVNFGRIIKNTVQFLANETKNQLERIEHFFGIWLILQEIVKNYDTLTWTFKSRELEAVSFTIHSLLSFLENNILFIIQQESIRNLEESLEGLIAIASNSKLHEREMLSFSESFWNGSMGILESFSSKKKQKMVSGGFKRRKYALMAKKVSVFLLKFKGFNAMVELAKRDKMVFEKILSYLQDDKNYVFEDARQAAENLLSLHGLSHL